MLSRSDSTEKRDGAGEDRAGSCFLAAVPGRGAVSGQGQAAQGQGALPAKSTLVGAVGCVGRAGGFWGPCPPSCV